MLAINRHPLMFGVLLVMLIQMLIQMLVKLTGPDVVQPLPQDVGPATLPAGDLFTSLPAELRFSASLADCTSLAAKYRSLISLLSTVRSLVA
jgi:hypothetical protein